MLKGFLVSILLLACAGELAAEFNYMYPRMQTYDRITASQPGRKYRPRRLRSRKGQSADLQQMGNYDLQAFRTGAQATWVSDYFWRDFILSDSDRNYGLDAYAAYYGLEGSIFVLQDFKGGYAHNGPLETDYRVAYHYKISSSVNTLAYTYYDWSNSYTKIGGKKNGFADDDPAFNRSSQELSLSSYWYREEAIQSEGVNWVLGLDGWYRIDYGGFRTQAVIGVIAGKTYMGILTPNYARFLVNVIAQYKYYTDRGSFPGTDFYFELGWNFKAMGAPVAVGASVEYFVGWGDDAYRDQRAIFSITSGVKF